MGRKMLAAAVLLLLGAIPVSGEGKKPEPIHNGKALSEWLKMAASADPGARGDAMAALGKLGKKAPGEVVPALVKGLKDGNSRVREGALRAVAEVGPQAKDACPALHALLGDFLLAGKAIDALAAIGPAAVPTLLKALKHRDPLVRALCLQRLTLLRQAFASGELTGLKDHVPTLVGLLKGKDVGSRRWAAKILEYIGPESKDAVGPLTAALKDADPIVRSGAAMALSQIGPDARAAVPELLKAMRAREPKQDAEQPLTAALALWRIEGNSRDTVPVVAEVLGREKKEGLFGVRDTAAFILFVIGPEAKAARPALQKALKDRNERVRAIAAFALARIDHPKKTALEALLDGTRAKEAPTRRMALETLGIACDHRVISRDDARKMAVPRLVELAKGPDEQVRLTAAYLLRRYAPEAATKPKKGE